MKFVAFFWNIGLDIDRTLSVRVTVQKFSNLDMCHKVAIAMRT